MEFKEYLLNYGLKTHKEFENHLRYCILQKLGITRIVKETNEKFLLHATQNPTLTTFYHVIKNYDNIDYIKSYYAFYDIQANFNDNIWLASYSKSITEVFEELGFKDYNIEAILTNDSIDEERYIKITITYEYRMEKV